MLPPGLLFRASSGVGVLVVVGVPVASEDFGFRRDGEIEREGVVCVCSIYEMIAYFCYGHVGLEWGYAGFNIYHRFGVAGNTGQVSIQREDAGGAVVL